MKKYIGLTLLGLVVVAAFWLFERDFPADAVDAKYTNDASQFMTTSDGARVHFRDQGNPQGAPVVLVHGSNASLLTWEPWVQILGATYRVITLDLPGHGLTGAVPSQAYDSVAQLDTLEALVNHLALPNFVLGGNSMGGGVTWRYALRHPEQIYAMLLIDASGPGQWWEQEAANANDENGGDAEEDDNEGPLAFRLLREPWFRSIAMYLDTKALTTQGLRSAFHDPAKVTPDMIEQYYQMSMREGTRAATMARFASFGSRQSGEDPTEADLATLTMPTLVMWGATDALISAEYGERFAAILPNATLVIYPEVGHIPMEEVPARSAADVQSFLAANLGR